MSKQNESSSQHLIKGTLLYAAGNLGTKILSFLIVPFYTYYISTEQYGIYENLVTAGNLLLPLITLQIADAVYTRVLSGKGEQKGSIQAAYLVFIAGAILSSILIGVVSLFFPFRYSGIFIIYNITQALYFTVQKLLRAVKKQGLYAISGIFYTIVFLSLNVVQILFLHMGIDAFLISAIVAGILATGFMWIKTPAIRPVHFKEASGSEIRSLLSFSIPLIPNQINWWVMNFSDKFLITFFLGLSANGIYGISTRFPTLLQMAMDFFNTSWSDVSIADKNQDAGEYYSMVFEKLYLFGFTLLIPLIPATQLFITLFMNSSYHTAQNYVGILYLATLFQAFSSFYGVGYLKGGKTMQAGSTSVYGAIINFLVNLLFIKVIGLQAAALSTLAGFALMWIIRERQNRNSLHIRISWKKFFLGLGADLFIVAFCLYVGFWAKMLLVFTGAFLFLALNRSLVFSTLTVVRRLIRR